MLKNLPLICNRQTGRFSSRDTSGRNADFWNLPPHYSAVLADIRGPAQITHIWMTQQSHYRECLLKITYDDAPYPSLLVPLGDFFCLGNAIVNTFQSALFTASTWSNYHINHPCALNCYAPMPFAKRALVELVNDSDEPHGQYFYIDYESLPDFPADMGYFHAEFRRANPFGGWAPEITVNTADVDVVNKERQAWDNNYIILETRGRGHYIGCNLSVANIQGTWWGEGDDMIWVDGYKWPPDLHGTGSEDYFNQAWGMQPNAFLHNGSSIHENFELRTQHGEIIPAPSRFQTSYVFHLENPVRFTREIKASIEIGHANHLGNEISSVAYWYAAQPTPIMDVPPVSARLPVHKDASGQWHLQPEQPACVVSLTEEMKQAKSRWAKSH